MTQAFSAADWLGLFGHFLALSLLAIGGAITTAPDMHRYLVNEQHWLDESQFSASIALSQAAPGPNLLFVALLGWHVGLYAAGAGPAPSLNLSLVLMGLAGTLVCMVGILLPSTTLTFVAARWAQRNRDLLAVRAFKAGLAPIVIALLASTGWILVASHGPFASHWQLWLLSGLVTLLVWRTRIHLLWLLAAGGVVGWMGWV